MDTLRYDTSGRETLQLGRQGENRARELRIDVADLLREWPGAEITLLHQRPGDEEIYPVAAEIQGTELIWRPTSADTALAGRGLAEVRATIDGVLAKSVMLRTKVVASLTGHETETPDPAKDWVDRVIQATQNPPVKDVQVAGASILADGIANVPMASPSGVGVMRPYSNGFYSVDTSGGAVLIPATNAEIATHTNALRPITPSNLDYAVKAAMCDGKGAAWTAAEQQAARGRMGLEKPYELIEEIVLDEEATIDRVAEPDGTPYNFLALVIKSEFPASEKTGNVPINFRIGTDNYLNSYFINPYDKTATKYGYCKIKLDGPAYRTGWWTCVHNQGEFAPYYENPLAQNKLFTTDGNISGVGIITEMPVGTKLQIYGVRA